jgi:putative ABC transport system ATP-binding protein
MAAENGKKVPAASPAAAATVTAPSAEAAVIRIENVHKIYDLGEVQVHALRGITLEIYRGEFVAIMGASGSGKSTFMNIVGCLDRPTRGSYFLSGTNVATLSKVELARIRNRHIGFVFQGFNLLARTTALENVELPGIYAGMPTSERREQAMEALRQVGLTGREHHFPSQLSGGQQQRVAIARALMNKPSLLLADEPTGNLDSRTAVEIMDILQQLNANAGLTIVLVTHEPDIACYTKRMVIFGDGKIRRDSPNDNQIVAAEILPHLPVVGEEEEEKETEAAS